MPNQATVTSKDGPALPVTALVLTNVTDIDFQFDRFVVAVVANGLRTEYDLYATATVTATVTGRVWTVAISQ